MNLEDRLKQADCNDLGMFDSTFPTLYRFWRNDLFERMVKLFDWDCDIEQKEIEERLLLNGSAGVLSKDLINPRLNRSDFKVKDPVAVFYGSFSTPTIYYDDFAKYCVRSPIFSGIFDIGKNITIISNNALRTSANMLIHVYATMLAHADITIINLFINARTDGTTPVVHNAQQVNQFKEYRNALINGKLKPIQDASYLGIDFVDTKVSTTVNVKDVWEVREQILNSFYNEIGVKTANEKKGNMIADEVNANDDKFLINIDDMLKARQAGCDAVNKMFGLNWSVKLADGVASSRNEVADNA